MYYIYYVKFLIVVLFMYCTYFALFMLLEY